MYGLMQEYVERHSDKWEYGLGEYEVDGTDFTEADMIRFEQVSQEILTEDMTEMLRNNPPDVVYGAFRDAFFQGAIRMFQRDNEMRNIVLTDAEARDKATRHFFNRALRDVREGGVHGNDASRGAGDY